MRTLGGNPISAVEDFQMKDFLAVYEMFYPALRRLLRLSLAALFFASCSEGTVRGAFALADEFLGEFDRERK
jgi:hypothetical protein